MKDEFIDIAEKIGADYKHLGLLLLEDDDGNKVNNIEISKHWNPTDIADEILRQWRLGKGKEPVTWGTFVECLRATRLSVLADSIVHSLSKQDDSKITMDSDRDHSQL